MRTQSQAGPGSAHSYPWTPARVFMVVSAAFHVPVGLVGLIASPTFPIGSSEAASTPSDHVFRLLETNGWHSLGALAIGLVSVYFALRPRRAREGALAIGVGHVGLFVSLLVAEPSTFWIASNAADQVVHACTAVGGIVSGLLTARGVPVAETGRA